MRKLAFLLIIALFCVNSAYADDTQMYVLCKPGDHVNVRGKPTTKSAIEGRLECGDVVETDGATRRDSQGREWVHITKPHFEAADVWICKAYLQESPVSTEENCYGYIVANGRTALRIAPGGKRIKWLRNGDVVTIVAMSDEWTLTTRGYVRRDCLGIYYEE